MNFYTSDPHFGHLNVIRYCNRPYKTIEEMNTDIIRRWNQAVTKEDRVYVLGDVAMGEAHWVTDCVSQLNGELHLIYGNHDRCSPERQRGDKDKAKANEKLYFDAGFKTIQSELWVEIAGRNVLLHHYPPTGESGEHAVRYAEYRPVIDKGQWLLHGHIHQTWKQRCRLINVGVDVWDFTPVQESQIESIIRGAD